MGAGGSKSTREGISYSRRQPAYYQPSAYTTTGGMYYPATTTTTGGSAGMGRRSSKRRSGRRGKGQEVVPEWQQAQPSPMMAGYGAGGMAPVSAWGTPQQQPLGGGYGGGYGGAQTPALGGYGAPAPLSLGTPSVAATSAQAMPMREVYYSEQLQPQVTSFQQQPFGPQAGYGGGGLGYEQQQQQPGKKPSGMRGRWDKTMGGLESGWGSMTGQAESVMRGTTRSAIGEEQMLAAKGYPTSGAYQYMGTGYPSPGTTGFATAPAGLTTYTVVQESPFQPSMSQPMSIGGGFPQQLQPQQQTFQPQQQQSSYDRRSRYYVPEEYQSTSTTSAQQQQQQQQPLVTGQQLQQGGQQPTTYTVSAMSPVLQSQQQPQSMVLASQQQQQQPLQQMQPFSPLSQSLGQQSQLSGASGMSEEPFTVTEISAVSVSYLPEQLQA